MIVIDGSNYIFYQLFEKNFNKTYEDLIKGFFSKINKTIKNIDNSIYSNYNDKIIVVIDGNMIAEHRQRISDEYKNFKHNFDMNDELIPQIRKAISEYDLYEENDDKYKVYFAIKLILLENFDLYKYQYCPYLDMGLCYLQYAEGDDVIAMIKQYTQKLIICSTDRDFLQLIDENTIIFNGKKFIEDVEDNYVEIKALMGDESDNIIGYNNQFLTHSKAKKLFENNARILNNEELIDLSGKYFDNDYKIHLNSDLKILLRK